MLNNLRHSLQPYLQKIVSGFAATGLSPNFWTGVGIAFAFASAIAYGLNIEFALIIGGALLLVSGFFDIVDGQVARVTNKTSKKGAFLDSIFDKIAEVLIFLGILISKKAHFIFDFHNLFIPHSQKSFQIKNKPTGKIAHQLTARILTILLPMPKITAAISIYLF